MGADARVTEVKTDGLEAAFGERSTRPPFSANLLRQLIIMGLVIAVTVIGLTLALELGARAAFPWYGRNACSQPGRLSTPFCVSAPVKFWQGPTFRYAFNDCGYRTAESCAARPAGLRRVAVIGTSFAYGWYIPYADTFEARASQRLRTACGGPVDFQNLSLEGAGIENDPLWHHVREVMPNALALKPTAIVTLVSPGDLQLYDHMPSLAGSTPVETAATRPRTATSAVGLKTRLQNLGDLISTRSVAMMVMRTLAYENGDLFLDHMLTSSKGGFLRPGLDADWRLRLEVASSVLGPMEDQARAAGVPFVVFYYPEYAQAIAARLSSSRPDLAPYILPDHLRGIVQAHGGVFIDLTRYVASHPDLYRYFYVSIDHPNSRGHGLMADGVVRGLEAQVPAFASCRGLAR